MRKLRKVEIVLEVEVNNSEYGNGMRAIDDEIESFNMANSPEIIITVKDFKEVECQKVDV